MTSTPKQFANRSEAGRFLAGRLKEFAAENPIAVGLPRGGVVLAAEIARSLKCALDVIIAGKLRAPYNPELAIGAVTEDGLTYLNEGVIASLRIDAAYIDSEKAERLSAVKERLRLYRKAKKKIPLKGRTVIITDDGLATGSTMISAIQAAHAEGAKKIIVAAPGGPLDTVERISGMEEVEKVVCPLTPPIFYAVSQLYFDFSQTEDAEVIEFLKEAAAREAGL